MTPVRVASILVVAACFGLAAPALGQPSDLQVPAEALFQDGKKLVADEQFAEAADKFAASYKLDPAWGPLFNLAHCHEQMGRTATAWAEFREAVSIASAAGRNERVDAATERANALEPKLVRMEIVVDDRSPDLVVTRNGVPIDAATWGAAVPVDPADYVIEASAPGKIAWQMTVHAEGEGQVVAVHVPVLSSAFLRQHRASMATMGGAVVLAGAGTGFAVWALVSHRSVGEACAGMGASNCAALDAVRNRAVATDVLFAAAGVGAAVAVGVFLGVEGKKVVPTTASFVVGGPGGIGVRF